MSVKGKLSRSRASADRLPVETMAVTQSEPFTPTSNARPESELVRGWNQLEADASLAETQLVSANFAPAVSTAMALLRRTLYVPRSMSFETRAAYVALQALYELDRFAEARDLLIEHYGELTQLEPEVLFLWVSLAIETKECSAAAATLKTYLHTVAVTDSTPHQCAPRTPSKAQSPPRHLSKAQYAAGAQLYALEVLAKGLGKITEAEQWVRQDTEPLKESHRKELLAEVAKLAPKSSALLAVQRPVKLEEAVVDSKGSKAAPDKAQHPLQLPWQAGSVSYDVTSEIQPAEEQPFSNGNQPAAAATHNDSSAQYKAASSHQGTKWVSEACSELAGKAHHFWHGQAVQLGSTEVSTGQLLGAAAVAGLLTFAAVAERKAIKRLATKSATRLQQSIIDTAMAAFSFTPNPMSVRQPA